MNDLERDTVLRELSVLSGKTFPAAFFGRKRTNPAVIGWYEYHNLVRGIYKPTGCEMATAILQTLKGPYKDTLRYDDGLGSWITINRARARKDGIICPLKDAFPGHLLL